MFVCLEQGSLCNMAILSQATAQVVIIKRLAFKYYAVVLVDSMKFE